MFCRELNRGKCKTYLLACERTRRAVLIDPLKENTEPLYRGRRVPRPSARLRDRHPYPRRPSQRHLRSRRSDRCESRDGASRARPSRSHSRDPRRRPRSGRSAPESAVHSRAYSGWNQPLVDGRVFTGDTLLIGGTGRADFPGGDAGKQYDAITSALFTLPDDTLVFPATTIAAIIIRRSVRRRPPIREWPVILARNTSTS